MSEAAPIISVEAVDRATAAVEALTRMLRTFEQAYHPNPSAKAERFRRLCFDLYGGDAGNLPWVKAASEMVRSVECGRIGRRQIEDVSTRFRDLDPMQRAMAAGLAMGFMTEFLPREG